MQKEFLTVPFEIKSLDSDDEGFFYFEGYASTFNNVDLGNDIVERGAFLDSINNSKAVPILWQHRMSDPIGISEDLFEDEKGLFIRAKLPKDDDQVKGKVIPQMKVGSIREMSIGYMVRDYELKKDVRLLKKVDLFEVSLVTKAMNPKAEVTGYKTLDSIRDVEETLREGGFSKKEAMTIISKVKEFSIQCDAEEKAAQRDVELKQRLLAEIKSLTNSIKKI